MYSILVYFSFLLALLLSILYPIANAGIRGISTLAIAVPSCTGDTPAIAHPPPPPDGAVVGVGVGDGAVVGVGDGAVVGVGVGVGGAKSLLLGKAELMPNLAKHAKNGVQLIPDSSASYIVGEYIAKPGKIV